MTPTQKKLAWTAGLAATAGLLIGGVAYAASKARGGGAGASCKNWQTPSSWPTAATDFAEEVAARNVQRPYTSEPKEIDGQIYRVHSSQHGYGTLELCAGG